MSSGDAGQADDGTRVLALKFAIAEDANDLAGRSPRNGNVLQVGFQVVGEDDEDGELVRIHEERDALDGVVFGIGEAEGLRNKVKVGETPAESEDDCHEEV